MSFTREEAEFFGYYRRLLAGGRPPPSPLPFSGLSSQALGIFERGLGGACVRFLLAEGGLAAAPTFAPDHDEHSLERRFWQDPRGELRLTFSPALYELLQRIYNGEPIEAPRAGAFDAADNLVLLMLVRRATSSRYGTASWAARLAELGPLPRLHYFWLTLPVESDDDDDGAVDEQADAATADWADLQQQATLDAILFALQPLLASCWLEGERAMLARAESGQLDQALALAERRSQLFASYLAHVDSRDRLDLLRAFCIAYRRLFASQGYDDRAVGALEASGEVTDIVERQRAYGRLAASYGWLTELQTIAATPALATMGLRRSKVIGLFKSCFSDAATPRAQQSAEALLDVLSHPQQPQQVPS